MSDRSASREAAAILLSAFFVAVVPETSAAAASLATLDEPATVTFFAGVASAPGGNDTQWRSEVVLTNISDGVAAVRLEVVRRGETGVVGSQSLTLAPGETRRIPDLYAAMSIPSGAGTLRVTGDVLSWVRTFNQGTTGTFGQDVPPATSETGFPGGTPVFFPINTPADSKTQFRSNLLLLNTGTASLTFVLTAGDVVKSYEVPAGVFAQIDRVGSWMGLSPGPAMLTVTANGNWSGMVSTIDPVLGDPTTVRGLVATTRSVSQFSGVASAVGRNSTQWRSEAVLYNPRLSAQDVTLALIPRDGTAVVASTTVHLGPLQQERIPDVYQRFSAPSGAGTLRVTGDVLTWVRTFNQGTGVTFGQDVPEVTPGVGYGPTAGVSFPVATPADEKSDFRSNFLVYNHESRTITLTFTAGAVTGTLDVPAGTFHQKDKLGTWLQLPPGTATVTVRGTGRWSGMVATIDPFLGDPTTMIGILTTGNPAPTAQGVPSGSAVTATIGPAGGSLSTADGRLSLAVPAGALPSPTALSIQPISNLAWGGIGTAYRLGPPGTSFSTPATLTFTAATADTSAVSAEGLAMGYQDAEGYWCWLAGAVTDPVARTVRTEISRISAAGSRTEKWPAVRAGSPESGGSSGGEAAQDYSMLTGLVLMPASAGVKEGETLKLSIKECLNPLAPLEPGAPDPYVNECSKYPFYKVPTSFWAVNNVPGGNATWGTIDGFTTYGTFTAPSKAPSPPTVTATAQIPRYLNYRNISLLSQITIGGELEGTFTLKLHRADGVEITARGEGVALIPFLSDENGIAYDMKGTITIDDSFHYFSYTCSLTDSASKPIPADTVLSVQRKPSVAQHWVMPAVSWNFQCNPGGVRMPVSIQYLMKQGGGCSGDVWLPLSDEKRPRGKFTYNCNPGFSVEGDWDFHPK